MMMWAVRPVIREKKKKRLRMVKRERCDET